MPELSLSSVSFSYPGKSVFHEFSLSLTGTGLITVSGPSGCGKTTLFRLLCRLEKPSSGTVTVSEHPSVAFQEYRLFPGLSAVQNVSLSRRETNLTEAGTILSSLGFPSNDFGSLPESLSGGMKQRVSLARALLSESRILLLDEPSKELDQKLRERLYSVLRERSKTSLILLSTHHPEETLQFSKQLITLEK